MGITSKYLTVVLKAVVFGALVASFTLSSAHAKDRNRAPNSTMKALRLNLWYLGVKPEYQVPGQELLKEKPQGAEKKGRHQWPEELSRALEKARI